VFSAQPPLYAAALAFTAYGIHWFALGWNRYRGNDARPNAGMSVAFMVISAMGATVFFKASDWPVGLFFVGLFTAYFSEFFASIGIKLGERALGLFHLATGGWLMYLAYAVAWISPSATTGERSGTPPCARAVCPARPAAASSGSNVVRTVGPCRIVECRCRYQIDVSCSDVYGVVECFAPGIAAILASLGGVQYGQCPKGEPHRQQALVVELSHAAVAQGL
jgi:hypothetical protein